MLQRCQKIIIFFSIIILNSCSAIYDSNNVIANRDVDYLSAKSIPPLRIPPGMSSSTIQANYPVPTRNYSETTKTVSLVPPELNSGKS